MGSSIGLQGSETASATAGGRVKLANGATYALTSHHVVCNEQLDERKHNEDFFFCFC